MMYHLLYPDSWSSSHVIFSSLLTKTHFDVHVLTEGNEARFIFAVASNERGEPCMSDDEYSALKFELKKQNSWVVTRAMDPLERLGMNTFLGYLHRELGQK